MNESIAARHQRLRRRAQVASIGSGVVWLLGLVLTPLGQSVVTSAAATAWPLATLVVIVALGWELVAAPAVWWLAWRDRQRFRRSADTPLPGLFRDVAVGSVLTVSGVSLLVTAIQLAGTRWWLVAGLATGILLLLGTMVAGVISRTGLASRAVTRAKLAQRLTALSARVCGTSVPVREWVDRDRVGLATVTGIGRFGAILLSHDLAAEWPEDEVEVVVAHELAHHRRHDLWRKATVDAGVATACVGLAEWVRVSRDQSLDLLTNDGLMTIPLLVLISLITWWMLRPIRLAQSRAHERTADRLAIEWTGHVEAFRSAIRRMETRHLAEERPSRVTRWYFHRHPTVEERLSRVDAGVQ